MLNFEQLLKIGLTEKESKIYHVLLKEGPSLIKIIAERAGLKRTTLYPIIEVMVKNELIGIEIKKKRKYYFVKNPEKLLEKINDQKSAVVALLPQLTMLFNKQSAGNKIQVYDTMSGLRKSMQEILTLDPKKDELLVVEGNLQKAFSLGFDFMKELIAKKKKLGIPSRTIISSKDKEHFILRDHKIQIRTSQNLKNFNIMLYLFSNKTIVIIPALPLAILIENKEIKESLSDLFEIVWKRSKPLYKNDIKS